MCPTFCYGQVKEGITGSLKEISIDDGATWEDDVAGPIDAPSGALYRITVKNTGDIEIEGTAVKLITGGSRVKVEGSGADVTGPAVRIGGGSTVDVQASVIKLN